MKSHFLSFVIEIILFIIISIVSFSLSQISSMIPVDRIILTQDISHLEINDIYNLRLKIQENGIILNNNLDIIIMPIHIFHEIYIDDIIAKIEKLSDEYNDFVVISSFSSFESIHFILKDMV